MDATVLATRNGVLDARDAENLSALQRRLAASESDILLHLHGGLVGEAAGRAIATRLGGDPPGGFGLSGDYEKVFIVWRTGVVESIGVHWTELFENDRVYKVLLRQVLKFVARKLSPVGVAAAGRGIGGDLTDEEIEAALSARPAGDPFGHLDAALGAPTAGGRGPVRTAESDQELRDELEIELATHPEVSTAAEDLAAALALQNTAARAPRVVGDPVVGQAAFARLDRKAQSELLALAPRNEPARLVFTAAGAVSFLVEHGVQIALRIVGRYRAQRDHGLYATVVEELARELYGDLVGATIWGFMKKDAADPFGQAPDLVGATLVAALTDKPWKRLTITAHSAGSIWAAALLKAIAALPQPPTQPIDLVLLAPAVRMDLFAEALGAAAPLLGKVRLFTMHDALERADAVLGHKKGYIYPMSLLYLVSALFEERNSAAFVDAPLLGMQRFLGGDPSWLEDENQQSAIHTVQAFFKEAGHDIVYAKQAGDSGFSTEADSHGGFDSEPVTLASVAYFLK